MLPVELWPGASFKSWINVPDAAAKYRLRAGHP
jgi:hypothetical protein